jgi:hypothetical protein
MMIVCHNKTRRRWFELAPMLQPWWKWPTKVKRERLDFLADNPLYTKRFSGKGRRFIKGQKYTVSDVLMPRL